MKNKLRKLHSNIWVVTATSFLTDISSEMIVYLIPLFLSNVLGVRISAPSAPFFFGAALALIASLLLWRQVK